MTLTLEMNTWSLKPISTADIFSVIAIIGGLGFWDHLDPLKIIAHFFHLWVSLIMIAHEISDCITEIILFYVLDGIFYSIINVTRCIKICFRSCRLLFNLTKTGYGFEVLNFLFLFSISLYNCSNLFSFFTLSYIFSFAGFFGLIGKFASFHDVMNKIEFPWFRSIIIGLKL